MIVVIISECAGSARNRSLSIIDEFLPRIGHSTWSGKITEEGLARLRKAITASASRNTSVACHVIRRKRLVLKWIAGSKKRFNRNGGVPVSTTSRDLIRMERLSSAPIVALGLTIEGAGLLHDLGKATEIFDNKLVSSKPIADPVRHELISGLIMKALAERHSNDQGWIQELSDPAKAAEALRSTWLSLHTLAANESYLKSFTKFDPISKKYDGSKARLPLPDKTTHPLMRTLAMLVLVHHRLPSAYCAGESIIPVTENLIHRDLIGALNELKGKRKTIPNLFAIPLNKRPLWEETRWIADLSRWAKRLAAAAVDDVDQDLLFKATAILGRTALQLGDHKASALDNITSLRRHGIPLDPSRLFANTNKRREPAEYLSDHMRGVRKRSRMAGIDIGSHKSSMQHVEFDQLPESIASPTAPSGSRFRWQVDAANITSSHISKNDSDAGFFGILMAGTGSGKTRAIPSIMTAASGALRYTLALGLRTLTLQSGDAYIKECGFDRSDVAVVIGSEIVQRLHELRNEAKEPTDDTNGTSAEDGATEIVVPLDRHATPILPPMVDYFLSDRESKTKIGIPILSTTIDSLMQAVHAKRGGHLEAMLRLATSDLVIDEIDDYGHEDLAAIGRLVFLAGLYGQRVLLSSATTSFVIAETFFQSYKEGYALHASLYGLEPKIDCGWYSDVFGSSKCVRIDCGVQQASSDNFGREHCSFISIILNDLKTKEVYRKGQIIKVGNISTKKEYFSAVFEGMRLLHNNNAFVDDVTGKRLSIGVVRWNNVSPSIEYVEWLSKQQPDDIVCKIIPYNGRMLPALRFKIEQCLDELLTRKPTSTDSLDPVLHYPQIRTLLDSTTKQNVCVVVVTTSMEEVGRDHDFDWALTEPMSERSLVQMAGRVQRHRMRSCVLPNVGILERCLKDVLNSRSSENLRPFSNPGIESDVKGDCDSSIAASFSLPSHDASFAYNVDRISERIDASEVICVEDPMSPLAKLERARLKSYLSDGVGRPLSPLDYATRQNALITSYHADNRRFRRPHGKSYIFYIRFDGHEIHWRRKNVKTNEDDNVDCDFFHIDINEQALFIEPVDVQEVVNEIAERISDDGDIRKWQLDALLSIEMQIRDSGTARFRYHPWVGMSDYKGV